MADSYESIESTVVYPDGTLFQSRLAEEIAAAVREVLDLYDAQERL